jgi:hypothetical protein
VAIDVGTDPDAPKNISLSASNGPAFDGASALQMGRSLIFEIDPDSLPNPCQLVLSRSANSEAFGKSFDPEALRQALLSSDLAASDVVFGPPQPEQEELVPAPDPLGSGPA